MSITNVLKIQLEVPAVEHQEAKEAVHSTLPVFSPVKWCNTCQILQRCSKYERIFCKTLRYMVIQEKSCGKIRKSLFTTEILS